MSDHHHHHYYQKDDINKIQNHDLNDKNDDLIEINTMEDYYRVLEEVKLELPEPYNENGPLLSCVFDDLPPDAEAKFKEEEEMEKKNEFHELELEKEEKEKDEEEEEEMEIMKKQIEKKNVIVNKNGKKKGNKRDSEEKKIKIKNDKEAKKIEKQRESERLAEEKRKQLEDKKKEKEFIKILGKELKIVQKEIQKEMETGPLEDRELDKKDGKGNKKQLADNPPRFLNIKLAFPNLKNEMGADLLMLWSFIQSFCDVIGTWPCSLNELLIAINEGQKSNLLGAFAMGIARLIQADIVKSHNHIATHGTGGTSNFMDRALVNTSSMLEEARCWGFEVDYWRAHLNKLTWPEIIRQICITASLGPKRISIQKQIQNNDKKNKTNLENLKNENNSKLKMPSKFTRGTVKAAAWQVLSTAGVEGLTITEIAEQIQKLGLKDLTTSKAPESTVTAALLKDATFIKVAPATYALQAIISNYNKNMDKMSIEGNNNDNRLSFLNEDDGLDESDDEFNNHEEWIKLMSLQDFSMMHFKQRLSCLISVYTLALDSPTLRACMDIRLKNQISKQEKNNNEFKVQRKKILEKALEDVQKEMVEIDNKNRFVQKSIDDNEYIEKLTKEIKILIYNKVKEKIPDDISFPDMEIDPMKAARFEPIGQDRKDNRYWKVKGGGINGNNYEYYIFVEYRGIFYVIQNREQFEKLKYSLNSQNAKEGALKFAILRDMDLKSSYEKIFKNEWKDNSKVSIEHQNKKICVEKKELEWFTSIPLLAEKYLKKEFYEECKMCLKVTASMTSSILDELKLQLLKMAMALPPQSCSKKFNKNEWKEKLKQISDIDSFCKVMGQLEYHVKEESIYETFDTKPILVMGAWKEVGGEVATYPHKNEKFNENEIHEINPLGWLPRTFAAVALRLLCLDSALLYDKSSNCGREMLMSYKYLQVPFVPELHDHIVIDPVHLRLGDGSNMMSYEPIESDGILLERLFPSIPKGIAITSNKTRQSFNIQVQELMISVRHLKDDKDDINRSGYFMRTRSKKQASLLSSSTEQISKKMKLDEKTKLDIEGETIIEENQKQNNLESDYDEEEHVSSATSEDDKDTESYTLSTSMEYSSSSSKEEEEEF